MGCHSAALRATEPDVNGFLRAWLILGPFERPGGPAPGDAVIAFDYLTDGFTTEASIRPYVFFSIVPDYGGAAASTGLARTPGRPDANPKGVPTWIAHVDGDDTINFGEVYGGDSNDVLCYAAAYIHVPEDVTVNMGIASDDSIQVLIDGIPVHVHDIAREYGPPHAVLDVIENVILSAGCHLILVKVFDGTGAHGFRLRFQDPAGNPVLSSFPGLPCWLLFRRGDANESGDVDVADALRILNVLFLGGELACQDAADVDDNGVVNITDGIRILNFLFLGVGIHGAGICEPDDAPDILIDCSHESC